MHNGFEVEEIGIEDHVTLEAAQVAVLPVLAATLADLIRSRLDNGQYIIENGFVKVREEVKDERLPASARL
jgi:hypothetical protein